MVEAAVSKSMAEAPKSPLQILRERMRASQQQIADAAGLHVDTVQKIESGKYARKTRSNVLVRLAAALSVPVEVLTGDAPIPSDDKDNVVFVRRSMSHDRAFWQALMTTAIRYHERPANVLALGLIAFSILAERSLEERKEQLSMLLDQRARFSELGAAMPHLGEFPFAMRIDAEPALDAERSSIAHRDLHGKETRREINEHDPSLDCDPVSPFLAMLRREAAALGVPLQEDEGAFGLTVQPDEAVYRLVAGGDEELMHALHCNYLLLFDIPAEKLRRGKIEERQAWLRERLRSDNAAMEMKRIDDEIAAAFGEVSIDGEAGHGV